jgi:hypothetical protein
MTSKLLWKLLWLCFAYLWLSSQAGTAAAVSRPTAADLGEALALPGFKRRNSFK